MLKAKRHDIIWQIEKEVRIIQGKALKDPAEEKKEF